MNITITIDAPGLSKAIDNLAIALLNPKLTSLALPQSSINRIKKETKEIQVAKIKAEAAAETALKLESGLGPVGNLYTPPENHLEEIKQFLAQDDEVTPVREEDITATARELSDSVGSAGLRKVLDAVAGVGVKMPDVPKEKYRELLLALEVALKF